MDQATLRQYAADGIRRQITLLTQQLDELERPARKPNRRAARKPNRRRKRKSMWTPERREALSKKMKELALERKAQAKK
jgi:hypothetical protein